MKFQTAIKSFLSIKLCLMCCALLIINFTHAASAGDMDEHESKVRAAIVHRLLQYSDWKQPLTNSLILCTLGNDQSTRAIHSLNTRQLTKEIDISVSKYTQSKPSNCNVLVVGSSYSDVITPELHDTFVICNGCKLNQEHAVINLFVKNEKIVYSVNKNLAQENGIHLKSAILRTAIDARKRK